MSNLFPKILGQKLIPTTKVTLMSHQLEADYTRNAIRETKNTNNGKGSETKAAKQ